MLSSGETPAQDRRTYLPVAGAAAAAELSGNCRPLKTAALLKITPLLGDGPHPATGQWGQV